MSALEKGYRSITDFHQAWSDKVSAINVEKAAALERLQAVIKWEKVARKKKEEEISCMKAELESAHAELEPTQ